MRNRLRALLVCIVLASTAQVNAEVLVRDAWSRAVPPVSVNGVVYLTLLNSGASTDTLLSVDSPVAGRVHLHQTRIEDGVAGMSMLDALPIAPGEQRVLAPGGMHLMLMGLSQPLREGDTLPLVLRFEHAGEIRIAVPVLSAGATGPP